MTDLRKPRAAAPAAALPAGLRVSPEDWEEAWIAVLNLGLRVTGSLSHAEDARQEAFARLMTTRRWDGQKPFVSHMMLVASSILKHDRKARRRRERYEAEGGAEYKRERGETTASREQDLIEHEEHADSQDRAISALTELRRRLAEYPLELRLIEHAEQAEARGDELGRPSELAKILGARVEEVYRALARIRRYREGVYDAVDEQYRSAANGQAKR